MRSRWTQIFAAVFAALSLAVAGSGYVLSGGAGMQDFARTAASLVQLVLLLTPLTSLVIGVLALAPGKGLGGAALFPAGLEARDPPRPPAGALRRARRRAGDRPRRRGARRLLARRRRGDRGLRDPLPGGARPDGDLPRHRRPARLRRRRPPGPVPRPRPHRLVRSGRSLRRRGPRRRVAPRLEGRLPRPDRRGPRQPRRRLPDRRAAGDPGHDRLRRGLARPAAFHARARRSRGRCSACPACCGWCSPRPWRRGASNAPTSREARPALPAASRRGSGPRAGEARGRAG